MQKFPKPWYRPSRGVWYVTLHGKQHNLGPAREAAFRQYGEWIAHPPKVEPKEPTAVPPTYLVGLIQRFMADVRANGAPDTVEWYRYAAASSSVVTTSSERVRKPACSTRMRNLAQRECFGQHGVLRGRHPARSWRPGPDNQVIVSAQSFARAKSVRRSWCLRRTKSTPRCHKGAISCHPLKYRSAKTTSPVVSASYRPRNMLFSPEGVDRHQEAGTGGSFLPLTGFRLRSLPRAARPALARDVARHGGSVRFSRGKSRTAPRNRVPNAVLGVLIFEMAIREF